MNTYTTSKLHPTSNSFATMVFKMNNPLMDSRLQPSNYDDGMSNTSLLHIVTTCRSKKSTPSHK
jgi:hypothetical protein